MQDNEGKNPTQAGGGAALHYRVTLVEPTAPPAGITGERWYRYVLENGNSSIEGQRHGTRAQVTQHAREFAGELNARTRNGYRTTWTTRGRKRQS